MKRGIFAPGFDTEVFYEIVNHIERRFFQSTSLHKGFCQPKTFLSI